MGGYVKGTSAAAEIRAIGAAFHRAAVAIEASSDPAAAFKDASDLGELAKQLAAGAADFRAYLAARLSDESQLSLAQLGALLGISKARAAQLVRAGQERGNTVTDPGTDPEPAPVAAAIITSDLGVLIERRHDRIPPWTFPAGEMLPGESPVDAVRRRVPEETGITVTPSHVIGRRIHPKTGRVMIYVAAAPDSTEVSNGDPADAAEVRWALLEDARALMPDMFPPVRDYLAGVVASPG
jgi:8-oxo-dGTP diphosphatase